MNYPSTPFPFPPNASVLRRQHERKAALHQLVVLVGCLTHRAVRARQLLVADAHPAATATQQGLRVRFALKEAQRRDIVAAHGFSKPAHRLDRQSAIVVLDLTASLDQLVPP